MNDAVLGGHPDQDVLADLLAEALPTTLAREVESHVMSCPACERLLADAERVRALLPGPDPGPMPDDVWARIEAGLASEATVATRAISTRGWFDAPAEDAGATGEATAAATAGAPPAPTAGPPAPPVISPSIQPSISPTASPSIPPVPRSSVAADPVPVPPPPASMSFDEAPTAAWKAFLSEPPEPPPAEPVQQRVGRAVRSIRSRRDVRTEDKEGRPWQRPGVLIGAAAAGIAVLGLGAAATMMLVGDDHTGAATDALPGGSARSIVHASGAEYTALTLAGQVKALVTTGNPVVAKSPAASVRTPSASASAGKPGTPTASAAASQVPALTKPGTVAEPARLAACLTGLGDGGRQPVAVDLARWQGREAAVIVLAGRSGGFDVWVVARDCRPGAEGTLAFKQLPA